MTHDEPHNPYQHWQMPPARPSVLPAALLTLAMTAGLFAMPAVLAAADPESACMQNCCAALLGGVFGFAPALFFARSHRQRLGPGLGLLLGGLSVGAGGLVGAILQGILLETDGPAAQQFIQRSWEEVTRRDPSFATQIPRAQFDEVMAWALRMQGLFSAVIAAAGASVVGLIAGGTIGPPSQPPYGAPPQYPGQAAPPQ